MNLLIWLKIMTFVFSINAFRSSHQRRSIKTNLKNVATFTEKHLRCSLFLIKRLQHGCFPVSTANFLRTPGNRCFFVFSITISKFSLLFQKRLDELWKDTENNLPKTKLLHLNLFNFLNIFSFIRTPLSTRHIKKAELKQPSRNR